jgi:hypothetical protein
MGDGMKSQDIAVRRDGSRTILPLSSTLRSSCLQCDCPLEPLGGFSDIITFSNNMLYDKSQPFGLSLSKFLKASII